MKISTRTWQYWKFRLGIYADEFDNYTQDEIDQLTELAVSLRMGRTIDEHIHRKKEDARRKENARANENEPIDIEASTIAG